MVMVDDDNFVKVKGEKKTAKEETTDKYGGDASNFKMDDKYANGINMDRKPTDILMLILFIAFIGGMGYCTNYGYKHGNVQKLLAPLDGDKKFCGVTEGFEDYPHLYITNLGSLDLAGIFDSGICVKTSPKKGDTKIDGKATS